MSEFNSILTWWDRFVKWLGGSVYYSCNICGSTVEYEELQRHSDWHTGLVNGGIL